MRNKRGMSLTVHAKSGNINALHRASPPHVGLSPYCQPHGDETVSDLNTLLIWEKKIVGESMSLDSRGVGNCLHCVDDIYNWNTEVNEWLSALNGRTGSPSTQSGFAGHQDWRIPNIVELQSILLEPFPCGTSPCIDPIFRPTSASDYWSSTSLADEPSDAWGVSFFNADLTSAASAT